MDADRSLVPSGFPGVNLHLGDHICHFYHGTEHLLTRVVPFIEAGLDNGERCLVYLGREVKSSFKRLLGNKESLAVNNGALGYLDLKFVTELYRSGTDEQLQGLLRRAVEHACRAGFRSIRISGQVDAVVESLSAERLLHLEQLTGTIISELPAVALCEYSFKPDQTTETMIMLQSLHTFYLSGGKLLKDNRQFQLVKKEDENNQQKKK